VAMKSAEAVHTERDLEGIRVLCLDNEPLIRDGMKQLLGTMGAEVATVADRSEALRLQRQSVVPFDVVLADYHLDNNETGIDAVRELQSVAGKAIACIVISADDGAQVRERAREAGFRFLPKPVNAARLRALILALASEYE
jgi:CheY-like chemotaxis protein